jgi:hypothetical protein
MRTPEQMLMDDLSYYFVLKQELPGKVVQLTLSSSASFGGECVTLPFDTEEDTALYLLAEFRKGALVSEQDIETAQAILRGDRPMFVYEEKQPDGTLLLSLHETLPPEGSHIVAFGSRSPRWLARFLLRRLHESARVKASLETIKQAQLLMG